MVAVMDGLVEQIIYPRNTKQQVQMELVEFQLNPKTDRCFQLSKLSQNTAYYERATRELRSMQQINKGSITRYQFCAIFSDTQVQKSNPLPAL
jgi:hypothetical protein